MEEKRKYLNIGCGHDYAKGFINIDFDDKYKIDLQLDLEQTKLPYEDNSVDFIKACHILEHINNFIPLMKELHRVLKDKGILYIRIPEFPCGASIADPTHVRFFVPATFYLFTNNRPNGADTGDIGGLFSMEWIESIKHNSGLADRGKIGGWFTETEIEMQAIKN